MAVHILGNTTAPSSGANDTAAYNEIGPTGWLTMPANGYITLLAGYFGSTSGGAMTTALLLFQSNNTLLGGSGGYTVFGQAWQTHAYGPQYIASGTQIGVGWWVNAQVHFSVYGSGTWQGENVGSPSNLNGNVPGSPYRQGGIGYYVQWIDALSVSGVSPSSAQSGTQVTISGVGFTGGSISGVTFNGISASYTVNSDTSITATVPNGYTSGTLQVSSDHGNGTTTFTQAGPTISSISPSTAISGSTITINGYGFTDGAMSGVTFNGIAASTYSVLSNTQATAVVPNGYTTGNLTVTTPAGSGSIAFTEGPPTISNVNPTSAGVGQSVTITGYGYTDGTVSSVTFTPNGQGPITASYTVNSNTQITVTVPSGAAGNETITVNTNHGSASSNITVTGAHVFDGTTTQNATPYAFDGTTTQLIQIFVYDGTAFQQAQ